jgi:hypothetical protein
VAADERDHLIKNPAGLKLVVGAGVNLAAALRLCGNASMSNVAPGTRRSWEYIIVSVMTVSPRFQGEPWTNK